MKHSASTNKPFTFNIYHAHFPSSIYHLTFFLFTPIQKILPKAISKLGLKRETEAALICEKYRKLAPRLIHTNALEHTFPKYYRGRTLTVGVTNSAWAAAVVAQKKRVIELINEELGKKIVTDLKTRIVESIAEGHNFG